MWEQGLSTGWTSGEDPIRPRSCTSDARAVPLASTRFLIRSTGSALPSRRLTNEDLFGDLGVRADSIFARTGIRERRIAGPLDSTSSLGAAAAQAALDAGGLPASGLDLLILSTYTPDRLLCPTAPAVATAIGAHRAGAFDLNSACSGGVTALLVASSLLAAGAFQRIMVVAADLTTRFLRRDDPKTRLIFGDAAAALVLERASADDAVGWSVLAATSGSDGSGADLFGVPGPIGARPTEGTEQPLTVEMNGAAVYRFAIERGGLIADGLLRQAGLHPSDVTHVVPHQANVRIIDHLAEHSRIPADRWHRNLENHGNTASASVPLALHALLASQAVHAGDVVLLLAFGAGLTWSGLALRVT
jgi:3-oxoacyl-[acyl-carrier-protein] synthase-3